MQRNRFLPDMLSTLFDRKKAAATDDDPRDVYALCHALLSEEGTVSGQKLAEIILGRYRGFDDDAKLAFFKFLNQELEIEATALADLATEYAENHSTQTFARMFNACIAPRRELLKQLNQPTGATADLVSMRVDLLRLMKDAPDLARTDLDFSLLLRSWFNRGFLVLKQIDWNAPASLLDKIVAYEAVHEIDDLDDLRRRLSPPDRRCFAFFHPAMPDEPLIFVEVALTKTIPCSIDQLLSEDRASREAADARAAVFYSISNCQAGLKGISFGNLLIKQVAKELALEFAQLNDFVTLSPIPRMNTWLVGQTDDPTHGHVATAVLAGEAPPEDVQAMAARYLVEAKLDDGTPIDPATRFHLGNGAEVYAVHANADSSDNGCYQSGGAMVNYLYDLSVVEQNHADFVLNSKVATSKSIKALLKAGFKTKPKALAS